MQDVQPYVGSSAQNLNSIPCLNCSVHIRSPLLLFQIDKVSITNLNLNLLAIQFGFPDLNPGLIPHTSFESWNLKFGIENLF
jgi:hypothetical protein